MEDLPVEAVGKILSHVAAARDVVLASATCRKWRRAFREHLSALSFNWREWHGFKDLSHSRVEILITRTLFQTSGLQSLHIELENIGDEFSPSVVVSWLLHTRRSLKELLCDIRSKPPLNVVEIFGMEKLEKLTLAHGSVIDVDPNYHRFTSLRSLSLACSDSTHGQALTSLIAGCLKLESLELVYNRIAHIEVRAPNLRRFYCENVTSHEVILESDSIEHMRLRRCCFGSFKVIGKGSLKNIVMDNVFFIKKGGVDISLPPLEISDSASKNLETIDITGRMIPELAFYRLTSKSSNLRTLSLWNVTFNEWTKPIDLWGIAVCCPHLRLLSLDCISKGGPLFPYILRGSARFEKVTCLKVGWSFTTNDEIVDLVEGLLERCPSLKKLVIDGIVPGLKKQIEGQVIARFINSIFRIMRKCIDLNVQFECDN